MAQMLGFKRVQVQRKQSVDRRDPEVTRRNPLQSQDLAIGDPGQRARLPGCRIQHPDLADRCAEIDPPIFVDRQSLCCAAIADYGDIRCQQGVVRLKHTGHGRRLRLVPVVRVHRCRPHHPEEGEHACQRQGKCRNSKGHKVH